MKIFYTIDETSRVIPCCDWNENISPDEDWHVGDIPGAAYEEHGIPLYKEVNGAITARTAEEIQADIDAIPVPDPTPIDYLTADVDFLTMENEALEEQVEQQQADIDYLLMITEETSAI